ncbi:1-deoxy-D-xylulose-5-phosphate synthase [Desulfothermus sp.]
MKEEILSQIKEPEQIMELDYEELRQLAEEIRGQIISTVVKTGGHLAPSLGVVDLTLALYKVFNFKKDKLIWDVGHQAYAHKIITRGIEKFKTLRKLGGISGFPRIGESPYDFFGVGHSSTSISAALGFAVARDLKGEDHKIVAVIGDGSMTAGMAFEALNHAGDIEKDLIVVLNDNEMSISKNVGALSAFLSRKLADKRFVKFKQDLKKWLKQIPRVGEDILNYARRSEESLKNLFTPGILFEAFGFYYIGPVDGHDIKKMVKVFSEVKELERPVLIHVLTKKGKGYPPAEKDPMSFHGIGKLKGVKSKEQRLPSYSEVFGDTLCDLAAKDRRIVAITAAMPQGTGLSGFMQQFPDRFFDVGICEQHAVTFAAGLAAQGYKPVVAIYSTFLQRGYDQVIHDVCLQNLPVVFCLDRGGLVGEDGPTHHGTFDLSFLRVIPNMTIMAPKDERELQNMLYTALLMDSPVAIRYPRGRGKGVDLKNNYKKIAVPKGEILRQGDELLIIAVGSMVEYSLEAATLAKDRIGVDVCVFNTRFIKPLPPEILEMVKNFNKIIIVEENALIGGFSAGILELLNDNNMLSGKRIIRLGILDRFIEHGPQSELRSMLGLDGEGIFKKICELVG